jgi:hypothetical protein
MRLALHIRVLGQRTAGKNSPSHVPVGAVLTATNR